MRQIQTRRNVLQGIGLLPLGVACASRGGTGGKRDDGVGPPAPPALRADGSFRVIGYFPSWIAPAGVRYRELTHINYAFAFPTPDGQLRPLPHPDRFAEIVRGARAHGVKVALSVGGWHDGDDSAFEALAASAPARTRFVQALGDFVEGHGIDGVDMDWEYPDAGASARNNVLLMTELRARLGPQRLLTTAVVGQGEQGAGILPEIFALTDFVNIMAYDDDEQGQRPHAPYRYAVSCVDYWLGRGLPPDKLVLGLPFYGKLPQRTYRQLVGEDPRAADRDELGGVHYNGRETIRRKTTLALERGGGVMIWEITQDTSDESSLLRAIHEAAAAGQRRRSPSQRRATL
jgi:chitinase